MPIKVVFLTILAFLAVGAASGCGKEGGALGPHPSGEGSDQSTFEAWLQAYGRAWESRDPDAAAALFAEDATYHETPFGEPLRGRAKIREYWTGAQEEVRFGYELLAVTSNTGIAHWRPSFRMIGSGKRVQLDGIMVITLDGTGRCLMFREWWHKAENKSE
ncbi:MAG: nuclear transport factor 2 family protein [Acidobacteria bacterium]|nr:nuclear transport factor 2 family protein [Acidobacteriota bacterium]